MPDRSAIPAILRSLETQLIQLDRIGARLAAAHLDSAILQLRRDFLKDRTGEPRNAFLSLDSDETDGLARALAASIGSGSIKPRS
jgi:hypothetical protein